MSACDNKPATLKKRNVSQKKDEKGTFRGATITHFGPEYTSLPDNIQYLAFGHEICPTSGRPHLQMFAYSCSAMRHTQWRKIFPGDHIEKMGGSFVQNEVYCSKEGTLTELGVKPMENGKRRTVLTVMELIESGERPMKIARTEPELTETVARYYRFFNEVHREVQMERLQAKGFQPREVFILTGSAGTGKSRYVHEQHGFTDVYIMPRRDGKWFGNYSGQSVVVFNDVCPGDIMPVTDFLNITDGYPIEVEIKGAFVPWCAQTIYFTSNFDWEAWWPSLSYDQTQAVLRRVTEVRVFKASDSD